MIFPHTKYRLVSPQHEREYEATSLFLYTRNKARTHLITSLSFTPPAVYINYSHFRAVTTLPEKYFIPVFYKKSFVPKSDRKRGE